MNEHFEAVLKFIKNLPFIGDFLEKKPKIAVIRFAGVIADAQAHKNGISHARFAKIIDKAFDRPGLQAVAMVINSPGGSAAQTSLIANQIRRLAEDKELPVYAFVEDVAASGGYWLACTADEIYAQEVSIVGSIGVISASFGFEDFIEKHNIHRRVHTSGQEKGFLDPFRPETPEDLARLDTIQKDIHFAFKEWVSERRADKLNGKDKDLFEGAFWTATTAMDMGLIDGINDMRSLMKEKYGETVKLIDMTPERKLPALLPFVGKLQTNSLADEFIDTLEARALWSRYGL